VTLAIAGVRIWDGEAERPRSAPEHIRIEGGRIAAIGADPVLLAGAEVIRPAPGAVALPGLCDAHVHLTLDPALHTPEEQLAVPREELRRGMEARALAMVRAGITTARDLGGGEWLELDLRDRIARGELPGPRLLCAGQPVTRPGGHCHFWGGVVDGEHSIEDVVRRQLERGADCIKVMATGGRITPGSNPAEAQFETAELRRVRESAAAAGRQVAAHCHATIGIQRAAEARVHTVEHCSFLAAEPFGSELDLEICAALARARVWISPTINSGWRRFALDRDGEESRFARNRKRALAVLRAAGAELLASTDAGIPGVRHEGLPDALPVFADYAGLRPVEALRAATSAAARAFGLERETGRLRPRLAADLLVVADDPTENLAALLHPHLVVARGAVVRDDRPEPREDDRGVSRPAGHST
jgi:imidazolonepropionase-like amidohydrolase